MKIAMLKSWSNCFRPRYAEPCCRFNGPRKREEIGYRDVPAPKNYPITIQYDAEDEDDDSDVPSDLIVLGLPYKATQEEVR